MPNPSHHRITIIIGSLISVALSIVFFLTLYHTQPDSSLLSSINLSGTTLSTLLLWLAAWFFITNLGQFKPGLRHAYRLLCIGIMLYSIAQAQLAVVSLTRSWWWMTLGIGLIPYLVCVIFIFLGIRQFARLLSIDTHWSSLNLVIIIATILSLIPPFLSYAPKEVSNFESGITTSIAVWDSIFFLFATGILWRVKAIIGRNYVPTMTLLFVALSIAILGWYQYIIVQLFVPYTHWYYRGEMTSSLMPVVAILVLAAGYTMTRLSAEPPQDNQLRPSGQLINIIVYTANLASKPKDINDILDELRLITASLDPQKKLSEKDTVSLAAVYHRLEQYLATNEPLRKFTPSSLRLEIEHNFTLTPTIEQQLWPKS